MKRLILAAIASLAISANASTWVKVGDFQVMDIAGLSQSVMKLGEMTGNTMLGAMLAAKMSEMPGNDFFGAMRQGGSVYVSFYYDPEKFAQLADEDSIDEAMQCTVMYPMALPKDEFLKLHPGAVETNGTLRVVGDIFKPREDWEEDDIVFVAFSEDGRWAAAGDTPEQAIVALCDVPLAAKPMDGDVVRVEILPRGMEALRKSLADGEDDNIKEALSGVDCFRAALRISDLGLDIHSSIRTVEGTLLAKAGDVTLGENPLASVEGDAFFAVACSFDTPGDSYTENFDKLVDLFEKDGVKVRGKFSSNETTNGATRVFTLRANGHKARFSAAQRFAKVLPEATDKPLFSAASYSISSALQAAVTTPPMSALMPRECEGGIAAAYWREDGEIKILARLSPDEFKNLVVGISTVAMFSAMNGDADAQEDDAEYEEDDEDDDED